MIEISLNGQALRRVRFAYSPLGEVGRSIQLLLGTSISPVHRRWAEAARARLPRLDLAVLQAVAPPSCFIPDFLFAGAVARGTTLEQQLSRMTSMPDSYLRDQITEAWSGRPPALVEELVSGHASGRDRLAEALHTYWEACIAPYWSDMKGILDEDLAYRASVITQHGFEAMLTGLHSGISFDGDLLRIEKRSHPGQYEIVDSTDDGVLLVPSVFAWPSLIVAQDPMGVPSLNYGARGVGRLWGTGSLGAAEDAVQALIGRNRARILVQVRRPRSTTELARALGQSPGLVSNHLSVLRRSGMVTSWRSGREVLYLRSQLGTDLLGASEADDRASATGSTT
ncbi:DUF5937 family protein [Kribbella sp. NPDC051586]|uniref:ArsR/SmtB family transcription factor n=1 Tax=Kribbella sp. NPDC051586 TaxID=3364118 RepID=UPI0037A649A1